MHYISKWTRKVTIFIVDVIEKNVTSYQFVTIIITKEK